MLEYCIYAVIIHKVCFSYWRRYHSFIPLPKEDHHSIIPYIYIFIFTIIHYRTGMADTQCFRHLYVDRKPQ